MGVSRRIRSADAVLNPRASAGASAPCVRLRFPGYRCFLAAIDLLAVNGALLASLSLRSGFELRWRVLSDHPLWFALISALWFLLGHSCDAYEPGVADRFLASIRVIVRAGVLTTLVLLFIPYVTPPLPTSRLALLGLPILLVTGLVGGRALCALVWPAPIFRRRVLIVGTGRVARAVAQALCADDRSGYELIGFINAIPENEEAAITLDGQEGAVDRGRRAPISLPVLGDPRVMTAAVARHGINALVLATPQDVDPDLAQSLADCVERGIEVTSASSLYEQLTGRVSVWHAGKAWYVDLPARHAGLGLWNLGKRAMDILFAGLGLLCFGLLLPVIALAIYLDSRGPIFYAQERVGKGGKIFRIFKFRSMVTDAEQGEALWAQQDDARVTRVGRFLRATYLDEFPQVLNVLRGDMSAVGPRPERPEILKELTAQIPLYRLRHAIKPGMAGWALVKHGYARTNHDALVKLQCDLYYIRHQSLWLDFVIILRAIGRAATFKGR